MEVFGSEDCLYLNVFAPAEAIEQAHNGNFSVIVYIMGESFQSGSAQHYGPDFLIEKDVIVVSVIQLSFFYLSIRSLSFYLFRFSAVFVLFELQATTVAS